MPDTPDAAARAPETIIAFDFGLRRIGMAVGQSITQSASPLGAVACADGDPDFGRIDAIVAEWHPARLVVGLPMHADGSPSELQARVRVFIEQLGRYGLPVDAIDERHTSIEAETTLKNARAAGTRGRIRKEDIDAAAAVMIAERYLNSPQAARSRSG
jgi:putative Holliday junction resolvase